MGEEDRDACNLTAKTKSASDKEWPRNHPFHLEREEGLIAYEKQLRSQDGYQHSVGWDRDGVAPG